MKLFMLGIITGSLLTGLVATAQNNDFYGRPQWGQQTYPPYDAYGRPNPPPTSSEFEPYTPRKKPC